MTDESSEPSDADEDPAPDRDGTLPDDATETPSATGGDAPASGDAASDADSGASDSSETSSDASADDGGFEFDGEIAESPTKPDDAGDEGDGTANEGDDTVSEDAEATTESAEATTESAEATTESAEATTESAEATTESAEATTESDDADAEPEPAGLIGATRRKAPFPDTSRAVLWSLLAMGVAGLALRLIGLGARVAHQDEGRVGYWIIRYLESGVWEYRAIVHGPFLFHVNKYVFGVLGPSDFASRLPVAVIGASLPVLAWLFREHLRDTEVIALGALLTLNPVLVYYSRFMREDVPLAFFMFAAVGFAVRYYDTRRARYVFATAGAVALGMTTKENGLLYAACWLGAAVLLLDHRLFAASYGRGDRGSIRTAVAYVAWLLPVSIEYVPVRVRRLLNLDVPDDDGPASERPVGRDGGSARERDGVRERLATATSWLSVQWSTVGVVALAVVEFFAIIVFFYAPRGGGYLKPGGGGPPSSADDTTGAMGLYSSLGDLGRGDPAQFVAVVDEATLGSWQEFTSVWGGHEHSYLSFATHYVEVMIAGALVVSAFAIVGFLVDRYGDGGPRDLVALCGYWGFVSVLGYPLATDIRAGWATTHAIVPLAIPAAVGVAILFRWAIQSYTLEDGVGLILAALLLLTVFGQMGIAVNDQVFQNPQSPDNEIIQYAQPSTDTKPTLARVERLGRERGGPDDVDVMFWGNNFEITDESGLNQPPAPGPYYGRRTWMWYMEMYQYNANQSGEHFVYSDTDNETVLNESKPPVVVTLGQNEGPRVPKDGGEDLHEWLVENGYERVIHQRYGDDNASERTRPILFYVRTNPNESTGDGPYDGPFSEPIGGSVLDASVADRAGDHSGSVVASTWAREALDIGPSPATGSTGLNASEPYLVENEQRGALCRRTAVDGARLQRESVA